MVLYWAVARSGEERFEFEGLSKLAEETEFSIGFSKLENWVRGKYLPWIQARSHLNRHLDGFPFSPFVFGNGVHKFSSSSARRFREVFLEMKLYFIAFAVSKLNFVSRGALIWEKVENARSWSTESLLSEFPISRCQWIESNERIIWINRWEGGGYTNVEVIFSEYSDEDEKLLLQVHRIKSLVLKVNQGLKYCKGNYIHFKDLE